MGTDLAETHSGDRFGENTLWALHREMVGSLGMQNPAWPLEGQENKIRETSAVSGDVKSSGISQRAAPQSPVAVSTGEGTIQKQEPIVYDATQVIVSGILNDGILTLRS